MIGTVTATTLQREYPLPTDGERNLLRDDQLARLYAGITKVVINEEYGECWVWTKGLGKNADYGYIYLGKKENDAGKLVSVKRAVHVVSYMHFVGPIPDAWVVDHMCNHKLCCNPDHLESIPNLRNLQRAQERRPWRRLNQYAADFDDTPNWRHSL